MTFKDLVVIPSDRGISSDDSRGNRNAYTATVVIPSDRGISSDNITQKRYMII